jgi:hypothetical protein
MVVELVQMVVTVEKEEGNHGHRRKKFERSNLTTST